MKSKLSVNVEFSVARWMREHIYLLNPTPRSVALFGSWVRGESRPESDIDLLLVGNEIPSKPAARTHWVFPLLESWREEGRSIAGGVMPLAPLILSEGGWLDSSGLRLSLAEEAWILRDDGFLSYSLSEARAWIREGLWSKKSLRDGGWLWVPKNRQRIAG